MCSTPCAAPPARPWAWRWTPSPPPVIGGTLLTGGVGNVFGSFFGVLINGTISSLVKTNGKLSSSWPNVVTALLLCFFIVLQAIFAKVKARRS